MPSGAKRGHGPEGIAVRHGRGFATRAGGGCDCEPGYQAQVYSPAAGQTIRKTFRRLGEARAWRAQTKLGLRNGAIATPTRVSLTDAAEEWLAAAEAGVVRTRSGERYKPSALRSYRNSLELRVLPALGQLRLSAVGRGAVQELVDRLLAEGLAASTVRNSVLPLRAIYRRARTRGGSAEPPKGWRCRRCAPGASASPGLARRRRCLLRSSRPSGRSTRQRCTPGFGAVSCRVFAGGTSTSSEA